MSTILLIAAGLGIWIAVSFVAGALYVAFALVDSWNADDEPLYLPDEPPSVLPDGQPAGGQRGPRSFFTLRREPRNGSLERSQNVFHFQPPHHVEEHDVENLSCVTKSVPRRTR